MEKIILTECPRDAMQGINTFIPTDEKITYLNQLLKVGFDFLDFGSFVSPKAIPQMKDTGLLVNELNKNNTKLLAIIANERGAEEAGKFKTIDALGFPFSISEEFQKRNTNSSRKKSLDTVKNIKEIADSEGKFTRIYLSMAFGNPYNEEYNKDILLYWAQHLQELEIQELVLSDTVGVANEQLISSAFEVLHENLPGITISAHFHSAKDNWIAKIKAANLNGCNSYDSAIKGFGGCPMAKDELIGNIATENLLDYFSDHLNQINNQIDTEEFSKSVQMADQLFSKYH